jgi:hypothetical protein
MRHPMPSPLALRTLVALAAAAAGLAAGCAEAAPVAAQNEPRVSIVLFPDVAGDGSFMPACLGCDGEFTAADALIATSDPLPVVDLELRDGMGMSQTASTSALAQGRQAAGFVVPAPGDYEIELLALPSGWLLCPNEGLVMQVTAADFDPDTGLARVRYPMTRGCPALQTGTPPAETATATSPATAVFNTPTPLSASATPPPTLVINTPRPTTATPTATETDVPSGGGSGGSGSGGGGDDATGRGSIRGLVFEDRDGDGALDPDEPGVGGVGVRLTGGGPWFDGQTGPDGSYEFPALSPGTYEVVVSAPEGRRLSTPDRYAGIAVTAGRASLGHDFGLAPPGWRPSDATAARALPQTGFDLGDDAGTMFALAVLAAALGVAGALVERRRARRTI